MEDAWFYTLVAGALSVLLLVLQRQWRRFAKLPKGVIYPPHVWSPIPFFGSALEMTAGYTRDFIHKYAKKFNSPVFTALIAGYKCVFIADSDLVYIVFKDSMHEIDSFSLQKKVMVDVLGIPEEFTDKIYHDKALTKSTMAQIHKFLITDAPLDKSVSETQDLLWKSLQDLMASVDGRSGNDWASCAMFKFVGNCIFSASVGPLISMGLATQEYRDLYATFDADFALLFGGAPSFMTRSSREAREKIVEALMGNDVQKRFSDFMRARQELLRERVPEETFAKYNVGMLVASVSNSIPGIFWTLYNLLSIPEAFVACREAVDKVAAKREKGRTHFTLSELDELMILQSAFLESLRLYQLFFVVRNVIEDFIINPKETKKAKYLIEKGTRIMALPNTVHMDPAIFEDPETFKYDRFIDPKAAAPNGTLLVNNLRPFGGGAHLCPGRKFIGYETRAFLAMLLLKVDMRLPEGHSRPKINLMKQGASVAHPERDFEFEVRIRQT